MKQKGFLFLISVIIFHSSVYAQVLNPRQSELAGRLNSLQGYAVPELAYIQTSKDIYEAGEDLWFKVYLLDSHFLSPSLLSKTLCLQLINESTLKQVWEEKYEILDGFVNGRVFLARDLPEGDFLLAAYTPWSFFNDTTEIKAVRRIRIKADITSGPLVKAEFDKVFYRDDDSVRISICSLTGKEDTIPCEIAAVLKHENRKLAKTIVRCDATRNSFVVFPPQNTNENLTVELNVMHNERNESIKMPVPCAANSIRFMVFPEGGYLVSGIKGKIAFKAVNYEGEPLNVSGTLFENGTPLTEFKSRHAGMGSFALKPEPGKKYKIRLSNPLIDSAFMLPEILSEGQAIQLIARDENSLTFKVTQSPALPEDSICLRVQCRGIVYGMTTALLNDELLIRIPIADLPQGIFEITLFNGKLQPVAERLVYINQDQKLNISARISKEIYPVRGKATVRISVKDQDGNPVVANLAMSVFDRHYLNPSDSENIRTHVFLTEQLRGKIYNPSYYFNKTSKDREDALDLLLLTQGWRKYTWCEESLAKKTKAQQVITDGIEGSVVYRKKTGDPKQCFVIVYSPNVDSTHVLIPADSAGGFYISEEYLKKWQGEYIYMKPFSATKVNHPIKLSDPFEAINSIRRYNEFVYSSPAQISEKTEISDTNIVSDGVIRIKEVTIKGKKSKAIRGKYLGSLDSLTRLDLSPDYVCRYNILNCKNHPHEYDNKPPVEGMTYLMESGSVYVSTVYHKKFAPKLSEEQLLKMYNLSRTKAYFNSREFYSPDYDKDKAENNLPDFRNTLLWEPSVITDEKGEATLTFYCSDIYSDFVGRIEGVGGDGLLGTGYFNFTVRKLKLKQ